MKKILLTLLLASLLAGCGKDSNSGGNFSRITSPESNSDITVFFWYRCPACYRAEKEISEWIENTEYTIEYRHSAMWEDDARLFYTLDLLGLTQDYQGSLMEYFRRSSNPKLSGVVDTIDSKYNESFIEKRLDSPHVTNRVLSTRSYEKAVGSTGVPLIIVGNRYALTGNGLSSGNIVKEIESILEMIDKEN